MDSEEADCEFIAILDEGISPKKKRRKPHITLSWTNEATHELIQAVEAYPCIWEYSCAEYKDRQKRDRAWQDIAEKFILHDVEGCKAKWANIKTSYMSVKKKIKAKSGQGLQSAEPHWPFWTAMQFYHHHDKLRSTSSVSNFEAVEESQSSTFCSDKNRTANICSNNTTKERVSPDDVMQRALKFLDADVDKWHGVGMYLALQLRDLAEKNVKAATKLHAELVKKAMEAILAEDE